MLSSYGEKEKQHHSSDVLAIIYYIHFETCNIDDFKSLQAVWHLQNS